MEYRIIIEETLVQEFKVIAENAEKALEQARKNYKNGLFVLEFGEVQFKQLAIIDPYSEVTEWYEF